jgi:AcrR family transcriptional regulator
MARKKKLLDRKDRIIEAADRLFHVYGLDKTTMEDIARESGIPRATVYLEFSGGKEEIMMTSIERYLFGLLDEMKKLAAHSVATRLETLKQVILHNVLSNRDRARNFQYSEAAIEQYGKRVRLEMKDFFQARREFFQDLLQQAAAKGEIPPDYDYSRMVKLLEYGLLPFTPSLSNQLSREDLQRTSTAFFNLLLTGFAHSDPTDFT